LGYTTPLVEEQQFKEQIHVNCEFALFLCFK